MQNKKSYSTRIVGINGIYPYKSKVERCLKDMRKYFVDKQAVDNIISRGENPLIYVVYEIDQEAPGELNVGCTIIYPGKVGEEYYFTKGHYHKRDDASEVYIGVGGEGLILMQDKNGESFIEEIKTGTIVYIPPRVAHRAVNTGRTKLVFLAIYPSDAGHDYEMVTKTGFVKIVVERNGKPLIIDNPDCKRP